MACSKPSEQTYLADMGRIIAVDYGQKRVGLAVTDPLRIIATALSTVSAGESVEYIAKYVSQNDVDMIVVGLPLQMNGTASESQRYILPFVARLRKRLPDMPIEYADERYTSKIAQRVMIDMGTKKTDRRDKGIIDRISAVIILQDFLEQLQNKQTR